MSDVVVTNVESVKVKRPSRSALQEYLKVVGPKLGLPSVDVTSRDGGQIAIMVPSPDGSYKNLFPSVGLRKAGEWMDILGAVNDVHDFQSTRQNG